MDLELLDSLCCQLLALREQPHGLHVVSSLVIQVGLGIDPSTEIHGRWEKYLIILRKMFGLVQVGQKSSLLAPELTTESPVVWGVTLRQG